MVHRGLPRGWSYHVELVERRIGRRYRVELVDATGSVYQFGKSVYQFYVDIPLRLSLWGYGPPTHSMGPSAGFWMGDSRGGAVGLVPAAVLVAHGGCRASPQIINIITLEPPTFED